MSSGLLQIIDKALLQGQVHLAEWVLCQFQAKHSPSEFFILSSIHRIILITDSGFARIEVQSLWLSFELLSFNYLFS